MQESVISAVNWQSYYSDHISVFFLNNVEFKSLSFITISCYVHMINTKSCIPFWVNPAIWCCVFFTTQVSLSGETFKKLKEKLAMLSKLNLPLGWRFQFCPTRHLYLRGWNRSPFFANQKFWNVLLLLFLEAHVVDVSMLLLKLHLQEAGPFWLRLCLIQWSI